MPSLLSYTNAVRGPSCRNLCVSIKTGEPKHGRCHPSLSGVYDVRTARRGQVCVLQGPLWYTQAALHACRIAAAHTGSIHMAPEVDSSQWERAQAAFHIDPHILAGVPAVRTGTPQECARSQAVARSEWELLYT